MGKLSGFAIWQLELGVSRDIGLRSFFRTWKNMKQRCLSLKKRNKRERMGNLREIILPERGKIVTAKKKNEETTSVPLFPPQVCTELTDVDAMINPKSATLQYGSLLYRWPIKEPKSEGGEGREFGARKQEGLLEVKFKQLGEKESSKKAISVCRGRTRATQRPENFLEKIIPRYQSFLSLDTRLVVEDWDNLIDILGLAVYGIIMLPHLNDYVDLATINAFVATREKGSSPVVVVLANTYYSLQCCHDGRGGQLTCCLPTLYLWVVAYTFVSKRPTFCPIEDFKWCWVPNKTRSE
ncbi:hypothetical protein CR513_41549, partial [Mucuna pruriens]